MLYEVITDFGDGGYRKMQMRVNSSTGGVVEIRTADKAAKLLASLVVPKSDGWTEKEYDLKLALRNVHDLSVSLKGEGQVEIDWMRFGQNAGEFALQSRASIKPWEQGAFETRKYRNLFRNNFV